MSELDDESTVYLSGGLPFDLDEIADCDGAFDDEFAAVPVEKVNSFTADQSEDVVYRGYAGFAKESGLVADPILANDLNACKRGEIGKPSLSRKLEIDIVASPPSFAAAVAKSSFAEEMKVGPTAPATPFLLMDTHFHCRYVDLNSVVNRVEEELNNIAEVAREFDQKKCSWSAICADIAGSARCHMTVNIYKTRKGNSKSNKLPFVVECNRTEGDHAVFRRVYSLLSEGLSDDLRDSNTTDVTDMRNPDLLRHSSIAYDTPVHIEDVAEASSDASELAEAVRCMVAMAYEERQEARLLAARLLCDFTANEMQSGSAPLCTSPEMLAALIKLAKAERVRELHGEAEVQYCAFLALSNLSRGSISSKDALIDAGIVPVIIDAVGNGTYKDAHIRRECASMLNNLSSGQMAQRVVSVLGHNRVNSLFPVIDGLQDERMKLHALMAKESLLNACSPVV